MKAKTGILTHKVKIKTKDNRKFNFDLYKVVAGESKWQKKLFERLQTLFPVSRKHSRFHNASDALSTCYNIARTHTKTEER